MATGDIGGVLYFSGSDSDDGAYTTDLVAAVTGKRIRVLSLVVTVVTTAGVVSILSGSTTIMAHHLALGTPLQLDSQRGVCQTAAGEKLTASNAAGVDSFISGSYVLVES